MNQTEYWGSWNYRARAWIVCFILFNKWNQNKMIIVKQLKYEIRQTK